MHLRKVGNCNKIATSAEPARLPGGSRSSGGQMNGRVVVPLLVTAFAAHAAGGKERIVVEQLTAWTAPATGQLSLADARASIFYPDGRFSVVNGVLGRGPRMQVPAFLLNEGYSVFSGCWSASGKTATAIGRPVYLPALINPPPKAVTLVFHFMHLFIIARHARVCTRAVR